MNQRNFHRTLNALMAVCAVVLAFGVYAACSQPADQATQPQPVTAQAVPMLPTMRVATGDVFHHTHVETVSLAVGARAFMGNQGWGWVCIIRINGNQLESWMPEQGVTNMLTTPAGTWERVIHSENAFQ